jgi:hypothetical protein
MEGAFKDKVKAWLIGLGLWIYMMVKMLNYETVCWREKVFSYIAAAVVLFAVPTIGTI